MAKIYRLNTFVLSIYKYHKLGVIETIVCNYLTNKRKTYKRKTKDFISFLVIIVVDLKETQLIKALFASRFIVIRHLKQYTTMTKTKIFLSIEIECIKEEVRQIFSSWLGVMKFTVSQSEKWLE